MATEQDLRYFRIEALRFEFKMFCVQKEYDNLPSTLHKI
jgi:hypothetical protein